VSGYFSGEGDLHDSFSGRLTGSNPKPRIRGLVSDGFSFSNAHFFSGMDKSITSLTDGGNGSLTQGGVTSGPGHFIVKTKENIKIYDA
jgi:hypothetical protein